MTPRTLRNWIYLGLLSITAMAMACQCFGQTDEVAVGVALQDESGWTVPPYPPASGDMYFVDQDGGNSAWDGRSPFRYNFTGGTYTHSTRRLVASGAFTSYTHTGGDYTDVIDLDGIGQVVIESKVDNDTVVIAATALLTGDLGSVASDSGPKDTPSAGNALCSDGAGDYLLFQRGDTWTITADLTPCEGASASEPQVYGAYGSGARPKIIGDGDNIFRHVGALDHVYFLSIHMEADLTIAENINGIHLVNLQDGVAAILIEDCKIDGFAKNILVQGLGTPAQIVEDVTIRRNIIINAKCGTGDHSQGIYAVRTDGFLVEENIFSHNGWAEDWEDTAILASGTTPAFTNGDTLTLTMVRYGDYTRADEAEKLELVLQDTNDASGTVSSVSITPQTDGDNVVVALDLTTGVASNVVAAAIQAYNGGADFACTSSGTADLVLADAGTIANLPENGSSYNPTIFNHGLYWGNVNYNATFRGNAFALNAHMAMKVNNNSQNIIEHDNLIMFSDRWGHVGNARYEGGMFVGTHGSYCYVYNNVCVESQSIANNNSNGVSIKNMLGGYVRNNFIGQRPTSEGTSGSPFIIPGIEDVDGGDYTGVNNTTIADNVIWNFHAPVDMEEGPNYGDDGRTHDDNTWSDNIVGNTGDDDRPLLSTELVDSGVMVYSGTNWWSTQSTTDEWFDVLSSAISTATWQSTYEATATFTNPTSGFTDPTRTSTTFATSHANGYSTWAEWWDDVQDQRQGDYDTTIMAEAVNDYIRAGFNMSEYSPAGTKRVLILQ